MDCHVVPIFVVTEVLVTYKAFYGKSDGQGIGEEAGMWGGTQTTLLPVFIDTFLFCRKFL